MDAEADAVPHGTAAPQLLPPHRRVVLGKQRFRSLLFGLMLHRTNNIRNITK